MENVFYILAKLATLLLDVVSISMMIRVILPFFVDVAENRLYILASVITEPLITPIRAIMVKLNIGQGTPIDWSFFVTYLLLSVLRSILAL